MKPSTRILACLGIAAVAGSCLADFDRHRVNFTEGPLTFRFDEDVMDLPADLLAGLPGACEVAQVGCLEPACAGGGICSEDGTCIFRRSTLLSTDVSVDDAYAGEPLRIDSVTVKDVTATLKATSFNLDVDEVRILWAPFSAGPADAREIARIGPLPAGLMAGPLTPVPDVQGLDALEAYLVEYTSFQLFLEFVTTLEPRGPCPEGDLEMELSLHFLLTGEPMN
jgi:hypothetical protein